MEKNQASEKEIKSVYMISMFQDSGVEEWNGEANGSAEEATKRFVRHEIHQPQNPRREDIQTLRIMWSHPEREW